MFPLSLHIFRCLIIICAWSCFKIIILSSQLLCFSIVIFTLVIKIKSIENVINFNLSSGLRNIYEKIKNVHKYRKTENFKLKVQFDILFDWLEVIIIVNLCLLRLLFIYLFKGWNQRYFIFFTILYARNNRKFSVSLIILTNFSSIYFAQ